MLQACCTDGRASRSLEAPEMPAKWRVSRGSNRSRAAIFFASIVARSVGVAELGFNLVLAVTATKVVGGLAADGHTQLRASRADDVIE
jgi:hypothetical protein